MYKRQIEGNVKISFINTDISRVTFRNCSFDFLFDEHLFKELKEELRAVKKRMKSTKVGEREEDVSKKPEELEHLSRRLEDEQTDLTLDNVLSVIRMLRENFDYCMKYEESGRLFVKEMDLKRDHLLEGADKLTHKIAKLIEWFAYSLYKWICLCGESVARPILLALAIIITFGILRGLSGGAWEGFESLMTGMQESLEAFIQLRYDGNPLTLFERILSALNIATLYISLHRKLERRIRE